MRPVRLLPMLALVALPGALAAQSATGTVSAVAKVQSAVTFLGATSNLNLGTITPGTAVNIAPGAAGSGVIGVQYNTPATITVGTLSLAGPGGATLPVAVSCAQASTSTSTTPTTFACGTGYSTTLAVNAATTWYIYLGGSIAAGATSAAPAGDYTGSVTLTATFSTF